MRFTCQMVVCCSFFVLTIMPALASVDFSVGGGYLTGDTQYQIGGYTVDADGSAKNLHFPLSELRFPLDAYVIKGQLDLGFAEKWGLMFSAGTNLTDDTGKMEDSDWGVWPGSTTDSLDIYSESDTDMTMVTLEGKLSYQFYQGYYGESSSSPEVGNPDLKFSYSVGLGYKYQKYDFDVYDLHEWSPSIPAAGHSYVAGLVLVYEAEYQIPYLELAMEMVLKGRFELGLSVAYAPFIAFQDKDKHVLRDKVNVADHGWDGDALMGQLKLRYYLVKGWYLQADFEALKIESEGRSKASFSGIYDHSIEHRVSSHQYRSMLMLGYSF